MVPKVEMTNLRGVFTVPLVEGIGHSEGTVSGSRQLSDAWWAKLAKRLLHPTQVEIIETFQRSGQPLSVRDLSEVFDHIEPVKLDYHVGRLRQLGALEVVGLPVGVDFMDKLFRLTREPDGR